MITLTAIVAAIALGAGVIEVWTHAAASAAACKSAEALAIGQAR